MNYLTRNSYEKMVEEEQEDDQASHRALPEHFQLYCFNLTRFDFHRQLFRNDNKAKLSQAGVGAWQKDLCNFLLKSKTPC